MAGWVKGLMDEWKDGDLNRIDGWERLENG